MPLDLASPSANRAGRLKQDLAGLEAQALIKAAFGHSHSGKTAVVSSFGAESVVLLHMVSQVAPDTPILFIDTQMLFPETLDYQRELAEKLGLTNIQVIRAKAVDLAHQDPANALHKADTDLCCHIRKTLPLERALVPYDSWISGRKRFQSGSREALEAVEATDGRVKINPLAGWSAQDLADYIAEHDLPRHPLVAQGYPSIGCAPCTSKVAPGEDARAGRWRGQDKEECGIHFVDGKVVRGPVADAPQPGA